MLDTKVIQNKFKFPDLADHSELLGTLGDGLDAEDEVDGEE
jgi:hypothetical protein